MTETAEFTALSWRGEAVLRRHEEIVEFLTRKGMSDLANLFAAPVLGKQTDAGFRQVSWYAQLQGNVASLSELQGPDREAAEGRLRDQMRRLKPLLDDADAGGLLRRALVIPGLESVAVIFGNAVLINWGLAPAAAVADDDALARHWSATLGPYATFALSSLEPQPQIGNTVPAGPVTAPALQPAVPVANTIPPRLPWYQRPGAWTACGIGLALVGGLVGLLLRPLFAKDPMLARAIDAQEAINQGLEIEITRLQALDASRTCPADGSAIAPLQFSPVAPVEGQTPPAQPISLAAQLETGSALVVTPNGTGSGFFVAPGILVTNHHVIEGAKSDKVLVTSKALGKIHVAQVIAAARDEGRDYAILKVEGDLGQSKPLELSSRAEKLEQVVAAGYPGLLIQNDPKFQELREGNVSAVPELVFSEGIVSTKLDLTPQVIAHTAIISQGNSGGPLVDRCGRVLGINTLIQTRDHSTHQANLSLVATDVVQFLGQNGINIQVAAGQCSTPQR